MQNGAAVEANLSSSWLQQAADGRSDDCNHSGQTARRHFRRTGTLLQTAASTRDGIAGYEMTSNIERPSTSPGSAEGN
jgi:hypothetical protein